jgi:hypothetical protein
MKHDATYQSKKTKQTVVIRGVPVERYLKDSQEPLYSMETAQKVQGIIKAALKSPLPYIETQFESALTLFSSKAKPKAA